ncbi:MAG: radical SAM protein [Candidatus Bathyarchaeia archaeon]
MLRYWPHPENWGEFVDVKVNAPEVLKQQLHRRSPAPVLLSSVTDPYQPLEEKYCLTRRCLQSLLEADFPVSILTKSALVCRDIDLFRRFTSCEVGLTITTLDEKVRLVFEPNASSSWSRIDALEKLGDAGLSTYAFIGPVIPILGEEMLEDLADELCRVKVTRVLVDRLNIKAGNWFAIEEAIMCNYPSHLTRIRKALSRESDYYERLRQKASSLFANKGLQAFFCY